MAKVYYDKDADLDLIKSKTVAIIGYGIQGRGQALCLRDSGVNVIVSQREGGPNYDLAKKDGFDPVAAEVAAEKANVIQILTQDPIQAQLYNEKIAPHMKKGKAICFSHGFNIRFKAIKPAKKLDVFMVAPKGPGSLVRRMYEEGKGVPCLVAVHQNPSGNALQLALSYAKAIGGTRMGVIETTFAEETETDLFGEQAVLCGGASELVKAGFETLVAAGYQPEIAYFEVLHELKLITDLIQEVGITGMYKRVSTTACYGGMTRGPRVIDARAKKAMAKILKEIRTGKFAKEWMAENQSGLKNFNALVENENKHPIEGVGKALREMMPWMKK